MGSDYNTLSDIIIYPSPFKDEINIITPNLIKSVEIMTVTGQKIKDIIFAHKTINTSNLGSGVYFVVIEGIEGSKSIYNGFYPPFFRATHL